MVQIQRLDYDGLESLIKNGTVEVDMVVNELGMTSMHIVCSILNNKIDWLIHTLLKYNANPNIQDVHGRTPLHFAASCGNINAITYLVRNCNIFG